MSDKSKQRQNVVNEIVSSEKTFGKTLKICVDLYVKPLRENQMISADDMEVLFCNLDELSDRSEVLSNQLEERLKEFDINDNICDVFLANVCFICFSVISSRTNKVIESSV